MTGSRRHEPVNVTPRDRDGLEAPVRPVLSRQRGARSQMGLMAVAAVAIVVLAAGIGLGGSDHVPGPSADDPSPRVSTGAPRSSGREPVASPERTAMNSSGCIPADPADLPRVKVASTHDERHAALGVGRPGEEEATDGPLATLPTSAWPVPVPSSALILESASDIVVAADKDACMRSVVAEYLAVTDLGGAPTTLGLGEGNVVPPQPRVVLGGLPIGDWLVRVVVDFATGVAGDEDSAVVERFFRVTTDVNPAVSPEVTPAVACATLDPDTVVGLSLRVGDAEPVAGVDLDTYTGDITRTGAIVEGSMLDPLILSIDDDACATSWTVQWLDAGGGPMFEVVQENRTDNPYLVSQNRIELTPEQGILGHGAVTALVRLGTNRTVRAGWELNITGPPLPTVTFSGPDGDVVIGIPGCGANWSHPDGRSSFELCEATLIPETVRLLTIRSGDIVDIAAPGTQLLNWWVQCGTRGGRNGSEFDYSGYCDLGGGTSPPMRFRPHPGRWMIQVYVGAQLEDGGQYFAPYLVEILAEP